MQVNRLERLYQIGPVLPGEHHIQLFSKTRRGDV